MAQKNVYIAKIAGNAPLVNVSTEYFSVKRERTV